MKMQSKAMLLRFIVVSLFGFSTLAYAQPTPEGVVVDKIIAKVDDYIVLKSELERSYMDYLSSGQPRNEQAKCQMLESLVVNKMLVAQAEIDSVEVSDIEVNSNLDRRMDQILQGVGGSPEQLEAAYGKTLEQVRSELFDAIKEQMLVQRMQQQLTQDMEVSPAEVRRFFKKIPRDSLPYFSTEVKVAQIVMKPIPNDFEKEKVKQQLNDMRDQIKAGGSFAALARKYSEGPSGKDGGELGFYNRGQLDPAYEGAAMTLDIGEISLPVESQFGFHIIELQEKRGNSFKTRHILIRPKPADIDFTKTENFLDSLRTLAVNDSVPFQSLAKEHSDDQLTSSNGGFYADGQTGSLSVSVESLEPDIFFAIDTMAIGSVSKPIKFQMQDGEYAYRVLYFKDKTPPHLANLEDDYQKIASAALNSKKNKRLNEWFAEARVGVFIEIDPEYNHCGLSLK